MLLSYSELSSVNVYVTNTARLQKVDMVLWLLMLPVSSSVRLSTNGRVYVCVHGKAKSTTPIYVTELRIPPVGGVVWH